MTQSATRWQNMQQAKGVLPEGGYEGKGLKSSLNNKTKLEEEKEVLCDEFPFFTSLVF